MTTREASKGTSFSADTTVFADHQSLCRGSLSQSDVK